MHATGGAKAPRYSCPFCVAVCCWLVHDEGGALLGEVTAELRRRGLLHRKGFPESYDRLAMSSFRRGQRRRTKILIALLAAALLTGIVAVFNGGGSWEVHLAVDLSLGLYVALLIEAKRRRAESVTKLRTLESRRAAREPEITFHEPARAGGGGHR